MEIVTYDEYVQMRQASEKESLERRIGALEQQVAQILMIVKQLQAR